MKQVTRPIILTILCLLGFMGVPIVIGGVLIPTTQMMFTQQYGGSFVPVTLLLSLAGLTGLIGIWKMRRWGLYVYTCMAVVSITYRLIVKIPGVLGYVMPLIIVFAGFVNVKKMK